jgi:hypothetical protein
MELLAPNGKPSNLTPEQYHLVRTPEFIAWFGDWLKLAMARVKDPAMDDVTLKAISENVSKVVDENGEPLVVYHGTNRQFNVFDLKEIGQGTGNLGHYGYGFYFSNDIREAKGYGETILKCYLNIRKPFTGTEKEFDLLKNEGFTGIDEKVALSIDFQDLYKKIKSVDSNAYKFMQIAKEKGIDNVWSEYLESNSSSNNGKIDLNDLYEVLTYTDLFSQNNSIPSYVLDEFQSFGIEPKINYGYEHAQSLHWVTDLGNNSKIFTNFIKSLNYDGVIYGSEYVAFEPNQIKLADGTNTTFDSNNPDIRYENGGMTYRQYVDTQFNENEDRYLPSDYLEDFEIKYDTLNNYPILYKFKDRFQFRLENENNSSIGVFDGDKQIAYADNKVIEVSPLYQRKGIGLELVTILKERNPNHRFGSMTPQGFNLMGKYYDEKIKKKFDNGGSIDNQKNKELVAQKIKIRNKLSSLLKTLDYKTIDIHSGKSKEDLFIQRVIDMIYNGYDFKSKLDIERIAVKEFNFEDAKKVRELTEYAILFVGRDISKENDIKSTYDKLVSLYANQPYSTHRTAKSMELGQFSTPAPMAYLMGVYVGINKSDNNIFLEPTAGNGMLTIAGNPNDFVVNELDFNRYNNLLKDNYKEVLNKDASKPIDYGYQFDGLIANPPFATTKIDLFIDNYKISGLENQIIIRSLEYLKDNGKAAFIIGGHTEFDSAGRIKSAKDKTFLSYLYSRYNLQDVINISGTLYGRQGTTYPIRILLIDGKKPIPQGYYPLKNDNLTIFDPFSVKVINNFDELYKRFENFI